MSVAMHDTGRDILGVIRRHESDRDRKPGVGPSEAGHPCDRRLAYRLAGAETSNSPDRWMANVGTATHAWLTEVLTAANLAVYADDWRWLLDVHVELPGGVTGSVDCHDRHTASTVDFKVVGTTALRKYVKNGPGDQYRTQVHLYGLGLTLAGDDVRNVGVLFLPRSGRLAESHYWHEPFDPAVAVAALERLRRLAGTAPADAEPTDHMCGWCPFHNPMSTDIAQACPGVVSGTDELADWLGSDSTTQGSSTA